jgi:hypothetical protein
MSFFTKNFTPFVFSWNPETSIQACNFKGEKLWGTMVIHRMEKQSGARPKARKLTH